MASTFCENMHHHQCFLSFVPKSGVITTPAPSIVSSSSGDTAAAPQAVAARHAHPITERGWLPSSAAGSVAAGRRCGSRVRRMTDG